jgi:hypothetical protein
MRRPNDYLLLTTWKVEKKRKIPAVPYNAM